MLYIHVPLGIAILTWPLGYVMLLLICRINQEFEYLGDLSFSTENYAERKRSCKPMEPGEMSLIKLHHTASIFS